MSCLNSLIGKMIQRIMMIKPRSHMLHVTQSNVIWYSPVIYVLCMRLSPVSFAHLSLYLWRVCVREEFFQDLFSGCLCEKRYPDQGQHNDCQSRIDQGDAERMPVGSPP